MGIFRSFLQPTEKRASFGDLLSILNLGQRSAAGVSVSEDGALTSTAVWACVKVLAESIAQLPLITYRRVDNGGKVRATDHPVYGLLKDSPNPELTSFEFRSTIAAHVATWGNGFAEIVWGKRGYPEALWPLLPGKVENIERRNGSLFYHYRLPDNSIKILAGQQVLHVRGLSGNGLWGYSPVRQAMQAIGLSLALEEYGARFFGNGARPGGVLSHPGRLSDEAQKRLKASFNDAHEGLANSHRLKILEEGMSYTAIGIPPEEAQFLQARQFQIAEIARIYRVPLHMVGDLSRSTNNNIEHQSLEFVQYTLMPWLTNFEQAYQRDLLSPRDRMSLDIEHLVDGLLRGDNKSRNEALAIQRQNGVITVNEWRAIENMNPVEGGDTRIEPLNMAAVGTNMARMSTAQTETRQIERRADVEEMVRTRLGLAGSQVSLLVDIAERVTRRETSDVGRAVAKYLRRGSDVAGFLAWAKEFYEGHREFIGRNFNPAFEAISLLVLQSVSGELQRDITDAEREAIRDFVTEYVNTLGLRWTLSSEGQLIELSEQTEAAALADVVDERLASWDETQPEKVGRREATRAVNALAWTAYGIYGVTKLLWRTSGRESCPYCDSLNGKVVGIDAPFVEAGDFLPDGAEAPLLVRRNTFHPPVHDGCDCIVLAGG
jgi:HK97 family phage portal protein